MRVGKWADWMAAHLVEHSELLKVARWGLSMVAS